MSAAVAASSTCQSTASAGGPRALVDIDELAGSFDMFQDVKAVQFNVQSGATDASLRTLSQMTALQQLSLKG